MSEMGNFARRILAEHPDLEPGDTCVVNADGTVVRTVDLQQQLAAANQRIAELGKDNDIFRGMIKAHYDTLLVSTERAEAAERKLATCRDALIEGRYGGRNQYDEACCPVCRRGLGHNSECSYGKALAQIEQPQQGAISKLGIITVRLSDVKSLSDKDRRVLRKYVMGGNKTEARYRDEPEVRNILSAIIQHACNCGPRP